MKHVTVAAPFLGEFGWLIAMWVPFLRMHRAKARHFAVVCEKGQEALFEDFADYVIPVPSLGFRVVKRDCNKAWWFEGKGNKPLSKEDYVALVREHAGMEFSEIVTPCMLDPAIRWPVYGCPSLLSKAGAFKPYVSTKKRNPDRVAVHARLLLGKQPERNWDEDCAHEVCATLVKCGYEVVAIGAIGQAYVPKGAADMLSSDVRSSIDTICSADLVIGPSSGALHLANFCERPVHWWSGNTKDVERYETRWNPFKMPNVQVAQSWDPDQQAIIDSVLL